MRDEPKPPRKPATEQQSRRSQRYPDKGPYGRRWHPDFCGSGGVVTRAPFLDELDRDEE